MIILTLFGKTKILVGLYDKTGLCLFMKKQSGPIADIWKRWMWLSVFFIIGRIELRYYGFRASIDSRKYFPCEVSVTFGCYTENEGVWYHANFSSRG